MHLMRNYKYLAYLDYLSIPGLSYIYSSLSPSIYPSLSLSQSTYLYKIHI